jgi:hypothetical protein
MVARDAVAARLGAGMAATALAALVLFLCWEQVGNRDTSRLTACWLVVPLDQTPTTVYVSIR